MSNTNYLKIKEDGTTEATLIKPSYGMYEKTSATDNRDIQIGGIWYPTSSPELLTNGTFDTDISGWTTVNASSNITWENGQLKMINTTGDSSCYQQIGVVAGETIIIEATLTLGTQVGIYIGLGTTSNNNSLYYNSNTTGSIIIEYTPQTTGNIFLRLGSNDPTIGRTAYFDNISVFKTEPTLGIAYTEQFTYASKDGKLLEVEVADGEVVDIHYKLPAPKIVEDCIQVGKVIVTDNRATVYVGNVFNGQEITVPNPFGNENYRKYRATAEIQINGEWGESGWIYQSGGIGVKAESKNRGIVITSGANYLSSNNVHTGSTFLITPNALTSAPCRVNIDYIGEIND